MVFEPPPGFTDLSGDAADAPPLGDPVPLDIPTVGTCLARKPRPRSLAALSQAYNEKATDQERARWLNQFLADHTDQLDYERLIAAMAADELPGDTIDRLLRGIVTWGTERPFRAVLSLAVTAGASWRIIRVQIPTDPMLMPNMHRVLDEVERIVIESQATGDPDKDNDAREAYMRRLYAPEHRPPKGAVRTGQPPSWWPADGGVKANAAAMRALAKIR